jgi:hypothetical protein
MGNGVDLGSDCFGCRRSLVRRGDAGDFLMGGGLCLGPRRRHLRPQVEKLVLGIEQ